MYGSMGMGPDSVYDDVQYMIDEGATYDTGTATHHLTLYRHPSGALVFGAGTCQWSWGLDGHHDLVGGVDRQLGKNCYTLRVGTDTMRPDGDRDVQQATLNLFADMHVLPSTPQQELHLSPASSDLSSPEIGPVALPITHVSTREVGDEGAGQASQRTGETRSHQLKGWCQDVGGGVVAAVEVSLDGGVSWKPADVDPASGVWVLEDARVAEGQQVSVRASDDSGNLSEATTVECSTAKWSAVYSTVGRSYDS